MITESSIFNYLFHFAVSNMRILKVLNWDNEEPLKRGMRLNLIVESYM